MSKKFRVGLALGGGAARGLSHIGVLKVLEEQKIPIDIITGTSIGSIIGGIYASKPNAEALRKTFFEYLESEEFKKAKFDFLKEKDAGEEGEGIFYRFSHFVRKNIFYTLSVTRRSFISEKTFSKNLDCMVEDIPIENTKIQFAAVTVDLGNGEEVILQKGSLRKAISASCAIPGIVSPVIIDGREFIDGGWVDAVPIEPAFQLGADIVIGVDVGRELEEPENLENSLDIVLRSDVITRIALSNELIKKADFIIRPEVGDIHWADFVKVDDCIRRGEEATNLCVDEIKKMIRKKRVRKFLRI